MPANHRSASAQAEHSFGKTECCKIEGNTCYGLDCYDTTATADFLYRLDPGEPERYEAYSGSTNNKAYQYAQPTAWPTFGYGRDNTRGDLNFNSDYCNQGTTYRGTLNAACGGAGNWGKTDVVVWTRVCR